MIEGKNTRKKKTFHRVSRARLFDGDPLKIGAGGGALMALLYMGITAVLSLLFSYIHDSNGQLVLWSLLPGALLGITLLVLERSLSSLKTFMHPGMGSLLTAFLLFFLHIIGYIALSSLLLTYPLGFVMQDFWEMQGLASKYSLFTVNFFMVLAIMSWFRNVRSTPCKCI
jgi:hypothetical protein